MIFTTHPWTCVIVGLVILLAIGGVIWGVLTRGRWEDKGFMERNKKPLRWSKNSLPISLWYNELFPDEWKKALVDSSREWNKAAGTLLFMDPLVSLIGDALPPLRGHVLVKMSDEETGFMQSDSGHTELRFNEETGEIYSAIISMPHDQMKLAFAISLHELGHALGLEHDEIKESIMYPTLSDRVEPGKITDADAERIKKEYC